MGTFPAIKKVVGGLEIATGFDKDRKEYGPGFVSAHAQSSAAEVSVIRPEGDTGLIAAGGGEAVFRRHAPPVYACLSISSTCTHAHMHTRTHARAHVHTCRAHRVLASRGTCCGQAVRPGCSKYRVL